MGIAQSIFTVLRSKEEDEQQRQHLYPFLVDNNNNYKMPHNGAVFGSSSLYALFKNLIIRIFKLRPFAKPRKTEPILPVVNPTNNPPFLQIQDSSSSSSDSSSSPNTIYAPGPDLNLQLKSDQYHYSSSEDEVRSSVTTATRLQKQPVSSAMETQSYESSSSSDSSSSPNTIYTHVRDLNLQLQSRHYSSSEDEVRASATTTAWLQKPPVSSAMETESNEDEGSCYIKQMAVMLDVPTLDYQSLARRDMSDVVDSAFFSIEKEENEGEEVEEEKVINYFSRVEGKWKTHYNSYHSILVVGEGDFSFSASLAVAFGYAPNMIATSLDSLEFLEKHYRRAMSNIDKLRRTDSIVMHGIDATKIASDHDLFGRMTFDRIIFNFPFAGFFKNLSREAQLRKHQRLVSLFLENAKELIGENGEIHISHKTNDFHKEWRLESLASSHSLRLIEAVDFNRYDYKGYNTKCGFGGDNNFNCHPSKTYKFGLKRGPSSAYYTCL